MQVNTGGGGGGGGGLSDVAMGFKDILPLKNFKLKFLSLLITFIITILFNTNNR